LRTQDLEDKFWRAQNEFERWEERWKQEKAYLEESRRELQQRLRRQHQAAANDTIVSIQHQKPAPAAAARPPGLLEPTGVVERFCVNGYMAEVTTSSVN